MEGLRTFGANLFTKIVTKILRGDAFDYLIIIQYFRVIIIPKIVRCGMQ